MWIALVVLALLVLYAYGMARGTAWLDRCSDDEFRLLIWEAEPHRTADAVDEALAKVLVIRIWADDHAHVWLRIEGWIVFPWTRRLAQICEQHLADPDRRLFLDRAGFGGSAQEAGGYCGSWMAARSGYSAGPDTFDRSIRLQPPIKQR
jgi:hypothetical protein